MEKALEECEFQLKNLQNEAIDDQKQIEAATRKAEKNIKQLTLELKVLREQ